MYVGRMYRVRTSAYVATIPPIRPPTCPPIEMFGIGEAR